MTEGDPSWAGALAGTAYGLPVYHITEPEIKEQVDPALYDQEVGMMEMVLDVEALGQAVRKVRERNSEGAPSVAGPGAVPRSGPPSGPDLDSIPPLV